MNKKLLLSLAVVAVLFVGATWATIAYFTDTEASTGNTFVAGSIDLTVADTAVHFTNGVIANPDTFAGTGWTATDLDGERFFDFSDLKPGDKGGDRIELYIDSNPAYLCGAFYNIESTEGDVNPEPETNVDPADGGELDDALSFVFWVDANCDSVLDAGETQLISGKATELQDPAVFAIADSSTGTFIDPSTDPFCIAKAWCFGEWDGETGECDGEFVNNDSQGDTLSADIAFYAVQKRNNDSFVCSSWTPVEPPAQP